MTITVSVHNILPVTVVTYRKDMARADLDEFMAYFRDPDLFPLANDAIIIVEEGTSFNDLPLKEMLKVAKEMEKISLQHQKKGHTLPDVVTIVIKSPSQRVMGRLWIGLTDLVPGLKPKYKVCKTVGDAVSFLGLAEQVITDIDTQCNFTHLHRDALKQKQE